MLLRHHNVGFDKLVSMSAHYPANTHHSYTKYEVFLTYFAVLKTLQYYSTANTASIQTGWNEYSAPMSFSVLDLQMAHT